jgi:hypothetical protein
MVSLTRRKDMVMKIKSIQHDERAYKELEAQLEGIYESLQSFDDEDGYFKQRVMQIQRQMDNLEYAN